MMLKIALESVRWKLSNWEFNAIQSHFLILLQQPNTWILPLRQLVRLTIKSAEGLALP